MQLFQQISVLPQKKAGWHFTIRPSLLLSLLHAIHFFFSPKACTASEKPFDGKVHDRVIGQQITAVFQFGATIE